MSISGERPIIDLHVHSTASDGTLSPADVVIAAYQAGLDVVALTDHDTLAGWDEAFAACPPGLTVVPGLELSCVYSAVGQRPISVHVLGYLVDPQRPELSAELTRLRGERSRPGAKIVEKLVSAGHPITPGTACWSSPMAVRSAVRTWGALWSKPESSHRWTRTSMNSCRRLARSMCARPTWMRWPVCG